MPVFNDFPVIVTFKALDQFVKSEVNSECATSLLFHLKLSQVFQCNLDLLIFKFRLIQLDVVANLLSERDSFTLV